jgi:hypothetical protein
MKKFTRQLSQLVLLATTALVSSSCLAQSIAVTPGTISTLLGNGTAGEPAAGSLASSTTTKVEPVYAIAIAPVISGVGGDIYFAESTSYVKVIYEGGTAAESIILANAANNGNVTSSTITVGAVYTVAGTGTAGTGTDGGLSTSSKINVARGLSVDGSGNLFLADSGNNKVRIVYAGTGAPASSLITLENAGVTSPFTGYIYTVAGTGTAGTVGSLTGNGALATSQNLYSPRGIYVDSNDDIYIADESAYILRLVYNGGSLAYTLLHAEGYTAPVSGTATGYGYIIAGGSTASSKDVGDGVVGFKGGTGQVSSGVYGVHGVAVNPTTGDVYISDYNSYKIRKLTCSTGIISTVGEQGSSYAGVQGNTGDGGLATASTAEFASPRNISVDAGGNVYIADSYTTAGKITSVIRKIDQNGYLGTIAGTNGTAGYSGDTGNATAATLNAPFDVQLDASGNLIIADSGNNRIRKVTVNAAVAGSLGSSATSSGSFAFGSINLGSTSTGVKALLSNFSAASVTLGSISIPSGFTQITGGTSIDGASDCSTSTPIAAGYTCMLDIAFAPTTGTTYSGTATVSYTAGTAQTVSIDLTGTGLAPATTTALTSSVTSPTPGQSVTLTATVSSSSGTPNVGTVTFYDGSNAISGAVTMPSSGVVTFTTSFMAGSHSLSAVYSGAGSYAGSAGTLTLFVAGNSAVSTTVLTASPTSSGPGQLITLTVTVTSSGVQPTGTVTFTANGSTLATATLANGVATYPVTVLPIGANSLTASYGGDANNLPSTATAITENVVSLQASAIPGVISTVINTAGTAGSSGNGGLATAATLNAPYVVRSDMSGNLYVSDSTNLVRTVSASTGNISTIAGTGTAGYAGDGAAATAAKISAARGLAVDAFGNVYISDSGNNRIRMIYSGGASATAILSAVGITSPVVGDIYTIAGGGTGAANTLATNQALNSPRGVLVDSYGNVYFADLSNNMVRVIYAAGSAAASLITLENSTVVTPVVGYMYAIAGSGSSTYGGDGAQATLAGIYSPADVGFDPSGNLYLTEYNGSRVRKVTASTGFISTIAGSHAGSTGSTGDGAAATAALLNFPRGIWVDYGANVYIADASNNRIRKIDASGIINTIAGGGSIEGDGRAATSALVNTPHSVAFDNLGNLLLATNGDNRVRSVNVSTAQLAFPLTGVNNTSALQATISNISAQSVKLSAVSVPGAPFLQTASGGTDCSSTTTLTAGTSCNLQISFTPTAAVTSSATVTVTSNAGTETVNLSGTGVVPASTITSLTASSVNLSIGTTDTFIATVASAGGTPTGTVIFYDGSAALSTAQQLNNSGVVSFSTSALALGTHSVTAVYSGAATFLTSTSSAVSVFVGNGVSSTTTLQASSATANLYQAVTFTASVTSSATQTPTGTMNFYANGILLGSAQLTSGSTANFTTTALPIGTESITASYLGDANNLPSSSASVTVTVSVSEIGVIPGVISTIIGNGTLGSSGNGGPATQATLDATYAVRSDSSDNLYVTDASNQVRMVNASTGVINTIAGTGAGGFSGDGGPATVATINGAHDVAVDAAGDVYIADTSNSRIRMIYNGGLTASAILNAEGVTTPVVGDIYTIAGGGSGSNKTLATTQGLSGPRGLSVDAYGNVFVTDYTNNRVRVIYASGTTVANLIELENTGVTAPAVGYMYILAGSGSATFSDGVLAASAGVNEPSGVGTDIYGNLYLTEFGGNRIREVSATTGIISTIAGSTLGTAGYSGDGGAATSALLSTPRGVWVDPAGNVYIADTGNNVVRRVDSTGMITTIAGGGTATGDAGAATASLVSSPFSVSFDPSGNLLVATNGDNRVRSISAVNGLLSFPTTLVGAVSATQSELIPNTGLQPITPSAISIPSGFTQATGATNDCTVGTIIASGAACNLRLTFTPIQAMYSTAVATITTNAANAPQGVVSVELVALGVTPNSVPTTTTLATTPTYGSVDIGQTITLTATVLSAGSGSTVIPTGTVTFYSGTQTLGTGTLQANGTTTLGVSTFPLGTSVVTAIYNGDSVYQPSLAGSVTVTIYSGPGDFTIASSTTSPAVTAGQTAYYNFAITSLHGFDQTITFTCSGLPSVATCVFMPTYLTPVIGGTSQTVSMSIATATSSPTNGPHAGVYGAPLLERMVAPLAALLLGLLFCPVRVRRKLRKGILLLALSIGAIGACTGCSNSASFTPSYVATGTYTITVTGTAGSIVHSTTVTLTVK